MGIRIKVPTEIATKPIRDFCEDFKTRAIEEEDLPKIKPILNKIWKDLIQETFRRRKWLGLKTSNKLEKALIITIQSNNRFHWTTRLLYRNASDGEGGPCRDYAEILFSGYAANKPTMGKWMAKNHKGRLIDAQLFDFEGNPIGTHGAMPAYLKTVTEKFVEQAGKALGKYINKKFRSQIKKVK